jgi:TRAP-type C4-dicarboxylate transport system permease small subunit
MRWIARISNSILSAEKRVITILAAALVLLILLNVATRAAGAAIFWIDELAVYAMIWMTLLGASAMLRMRTGIAVTLATDWLPRRARRIAVLLTDVVLLLFAIVLLVLGWQWYDPLEVVRSGFDLEVFAQNTLKFIYTEPTSTLEIKKFWLWLAVPIMSVDMTIHALANLLEAPADGAPGEPHIPPLSEL